MAPSPWALMVTSGKNPILIRMPPRRPFSRPEATMAFRLGSDTSILVLLRKASSACETAPGSSPSRSLLAAYRASRPCAPELTSESTRYTAAVGLAAMYSL